uniref:DNA-directed RNA polymerase subunit beta'' n=1 Tax=Chloromonas perforata TaxID=51730 RepID=A0A0S2LP23_9CHLO|nr:beta'' subunit of RNA polymerase [Chloromonas perforata]
MIYIKMRSAKSILVYALPLPKVEGREQMPGFPGFRGGDKRSPSLLSPKRRGYSGFFLKAFKKEAPLIREWTGFSTCSICTNSFSNTQFSLPLLQGGYFVSPWKKSKVKDSLALTLLAKAGEESQHETLLTGSFVPIKKYTGKFFNQCFDKGRLKNFVLWFLLNYGEHKTVSLVEQLKNVGFEYASRAGISLGIDDLKIPPKKSNLIYDAENQTNFTVNQYIRGEITGVERFQRLIDTWHRTSEVLKQEVIDYFEATDILNPVYMMAFSGARGNISQVRQLVGMRGLMADPQGEIIDFPIRSNFREGLTLTEYIISSYGARKGIVDTALRTANAGYLTRRLVDVAQHVIISNFDCGTNRGIFLTNMKEGNKTIHSLSQRIVGRILARDLFIGLSPSNPSNKNKDKEGNQKSEVNKQQRNSGDTAEIQEMVIQRPLKIASRNEEVTLDLAFEIGKKFDKVFVRSPLICEKLICQLCYGWSLAQGNMVSIGEAVGVVAAQSIGEPGTQLTMRTFHTGGVFSGDVSDQIKAPFDGIIQYISAIPGTLIRTPEGKIAFLTKSEGSFLVKKISSLLKEDNIYQDKNIEIKKFTIPHYTLLYIRNGQNVYEKEVIAQISSISQRTNATDDAELTIKAEIEGQFYSKFLGFREKIVGSSSSSARINSYHQKVMKEGAKKTQTAKQKLKKQKKEESLSKKDIAETQLLSPDIILHKETQAFITEGLFQEERGLLKLEKQEKIYEAWTWGYAWILSGKIYEYQNSCSFQAATPSLPIVGDLLNTKSHMTQTKWSLSNYNASSISFYYNKRTPSMLSINEQSTEQKKTEQTVIKDGGRRNKVIVIQPVKTIPSQTTQILFIDLNTIIFKKYGYALEVSQKTQFMGNRLCPFPFPFRGGKGKGTETGKKVIQPSPFITGGRSPSGEGNDFLFFGGNNPSMVGLGLFKKGTHITSFYNPKSKRLLKPKKNQIEKLPYIVQWFPNKYKTQSGGLTIFENGVFSKKSPFFITGGETSSFSEFLSKNKNSETELQFKPMSLSFPEEFNSHLPPILTTTTTNKKNIERTYIINRNLLLKTREINNSKILLIPSDVFKISTGAVTLRSPCLSTFQVVSPSPRLRGYPEQEKERVTTDIHGVELPSILEEQSPISYSGAVPLSPLRQESKSFMSIFLNKKINFLQKNRQGCLNISSFTTDFLPSIFHKGIEMSTKKNKIYGNSFKSSILLKIKKSIRNEITTVPISQQTTKLVCYSTKEGREKDFPFLCFSVIKQEGLPPFSPSAKGRGRDSSAGGDTTPLKSLATTKLSFFKNIKFQNFTSFCKTVCSFANLNKKSKFNRFSLLFPTLEVKQNNRVLLFLNSIYVIEKTITVSNYLERFYTKFQTVKNKLKFYSFIMMQPCIYFKNLSSLVPREQMPVSPIEKPLCFPIPSLQEYTGNGVSSGRSKDRVINGGRRPSLPYITEEGSFFKNLPSLGDSDSDSDTTGDTTEKNNTLFGNLKQYSNCYVTLFLLLPFPFPGGKGKGKEKKVIYHQPPKKIISRSFPPYSLKEKKQKHRVSSKNVNNFNNHPLKEEIVFHGTAKKGWVFVTDTPFLNTESKLNPNYLNKFKVFPLPPEKVIYHQGKKMSFLTAHKKLIYAGQPVLNQICFNTPIFAESFLGKIKNIFNIKNISSFFKIIFLQEIENKNKDHNHFNNNHNHKPIHNENQHNNHNFNNINNNNQFSLTPSLLKRERSNPEGRSNPFPQGGRFSPTPHSTKGTGSGLNIPQISSQREGVPILKSIYHSLQSAVLTHQVEMKKVKFQKYSHELQAEKISNIKWITNKKPRYVISNLDKNNFALNSSGTENNSGFIGYLFQPIKEFEQMNNFEIKKYTYESTTNVFNNKKNMVIQGFSLSLLKRGSKEIGSNNTNHVLNKFISKGWGNHSSTTTTIKKRSNSSFYGGDKTPVFYIEKERKGGFFKELLFGGIRSKLRKKLSNISTSLETSNLRSRKEKERKVLVNQSFDSLLKLQQFKTKYHAKSDGNIPKTNILTLSFLYLKSEELEQLLVLHETLLFMQLNKQIQKATKRIDQQMNSNLINSLLLFIICSIQKTDIITLQTELSKSAKSNKEVVHQLESLDLNSQSKKIYVPFYYMKDLKMLLRASSVKQLVRFPDRRESFFQSAPSVERTNDFFKLASPGVASYQVPGQLGNMVLEQSHLQDEFLITSNTLTETVLRKYSNQNSDLYSNINSYFCSDLHIQGATLASLIQPICLVSRKQFNVSPFLINYTNLPCLPSFRRGITETKANYSAKGSSFKKQNFNFSYLPISNFDCYLYPLLSFNLSSILNFYSANIIKNKREKRITLITNALKSFLTIEGNRLPLTLQRVASHISPLSLPKVERVENCFFPSPFPLGKGKGRNGETLKTGKQQLKTQKGYADFSMYSLSNSLSENTKLYNKKTNTFFSYAIFNSLINNVFESPCFSFNLIKLIDLSAFKKTKTQKTRFLYNNDLNQNFSSSLSLPPSFSFSFPFPEGKGRSNPSPFPEGKGKGRSNPFLKGKFIRSTKETTREPKQKSGIFGPSLPLGEYSKVIQPLSSSFGYPNSLFKNNKNQIQQIQAKTNYYSPFKGEIVYAQTIAPKDKLLLNDTVTTSSSLFEERKDRLSPPPLLPSCFEQDYTGEKISYSALPVIKEGVVSPADIHQKGIDAENQIFSGSQVSQVQLEKSKKLLKIDSFSYSCMFLTKHDLISYYLPRINKKQESTKFKNLEPLLGKEQINQNYEINDTLIKFSLLADSTRVTTEGVSSPQGVALSSLLQSLIPSQREEGDTTQREEGDTTQREEGDTTLSLVISREDILSNPSAGEREDQGAQQDTEFINKLSISGPLDKGKGEETFIQISKTQAGKPLITGSPFRISNHKSFDRENVSGSENNQRPCIGRSHNALKKGEQDVYPPLLGDFYAYGDPISQFPSFSKDREEIQQTAIQASGQIIHYNKSKITVRRAQPIFISPKGILHKFDGDFIDPKSPVITLSYQRLKTGDIIQGIPKVEQFFEARTTKRGRLFRDSLPSLLKALFKRYQSKIPLELAVRQSFYKIQQIIVDGVQRVYKSQGVTISDKHLEVIVKQMTSKVRVTDGAQTGFFPGEVVDLTFIEKINQFLIKKITYEPLVLGITKASLEVDSFLSASSFQQTTRVLSQAAIYRKKDFLKGLKENVILGNLIPAGTGYLVQLDDF